MASTRPLPRYDLVPPEPTLSGVVDPHAGTGLLHYYEISSLPESLRLSFQFNAPPWQRSGRQPFVWELVPPTGERSYPTIRIAAGRMVTIRQIKHTDPGSRGTLPILGAGNPWIEVYRVQDDSLLPNPDALLEPHRLVREPYRWVEGVEPTEDSDLPGTVIILPSEDKAVVWSMPTGFLIRHDTNKWEINVRVPEDAPAAFAYEIYTQQASGFFIRVVHTPNVRIRGRWARDFQKLPLPGLPSSDLPQIFLSTAEVRRLDEVPPQGALLDPQRFRFQLFQDYETTLSPGARQMVFVFEAGIGFVPFIGELYDVAQLAYTAVTGRNFWGEKVSEDELFLMGLATLISVGFSASSARRTMREVAQQRRAFQGLLDDDVLTVVRRHADPELLDAIKGVSAPQQEEILSLFRRFARGAATALEVLKTFGKAVADTFVRLLDRRALLKVFAEDFQGFKNPILLEGFRRYKSGGGRLNAARWALNQTRGRFRKELLRELGNNYNDLIRRALQEQLIPEVTDEALSLFKRLQGMVDQYRDLVKQREGFGYLFEVDHLLEKRFFASPRVEGVLHEDDIFSLLVPKNPAVAAQMPPDYYGYAHTVKTQMLRRLIPNGAEDLFTLQQWWNAHVFTYKALGVDPSIYTIRLQEMFRDLAKATRKRIVFHTNQISSDFLPENGWPVVQASILPPTILPPR